MLVLFLAAGICFAEDGEPSKTAVGDALGALMGGQLRELGMEFDYNAFLDSMRKTYQDNAPPVSGEAAAAILQSAYEVAQKKVAVENEKKSAAFLTENARKKGIRTTASGLQYEVISQGKGAKPDPGSYVIVNYTGSLTDGSVFDSNLENGAGEPATIPLEQVIEGWAEGVCLMNVGGHYKFYIPPDLAYGPTGAGDLIPPNSVLVFDVELIDIEE